MTDVQKEIQKLKALINQKQTTAIFSNKSNESTKLALSDTELYINDMTRKFSFTRASENCYKFEWHYVPFSGTEYLATITEAVVYDYIAGHSHRTNHQYKRQCSTNHIQYPIQILY